MARKTDRKALGRGLSALLGDSAAEEALRPDAGPVSDPAGRRSGGPRPGVAEIPIDLIHANPDQPRQIFSEAELAELAQSIAAHGLLQPVLLRRHPTREGAYQIVAGERRWRAAQKAGLHAMPAVVREIEDRQILELAIIENVQRVDLGPIEEARGYQSLIDSFGHTQEELARIIGKSRSHVANTLRLCALPKAVVEMVQSGALTAGHARAILNAPDPVATARTVASRGLSVRQTEALVRDAARPILKRPAVAAPEKDADTRMLEADLSAAIGMRVTIAHTAGEGGGEVRIRYASLDQLDHLCQKLTD